MFLYNVTIIVEQDVHEDVKKHIEQQLFNQPEAPEAVALLELLDSPHEGITYCIQLRTENREGIASFQQRHLAAFQQLVSTRYAGKVLFFDSTMNYLIHG